MKSYIALRAGGVPLRGGGIALLSALVWWNCRASCAAVRAAETLRCPPWVGGA
ncbi:MAG: hypothetical protein IJF48_04400 [Clostridia bacterium]|nr:hypothetical protein [Clostridia bacterium]